MIGEKGKLKSRWVLCFIIFSLALLIYGNHLFKQRAKKLEDMRKKESLEFMEEIQNDAVCRCKYGVYR